MPSLTHIAQAYNTPLYYAQHGDVEGLALPMGSGIAFQPEGSKLVTMLAYNEPTLTLCGQVDLADAQRQADGNWLAMVLSR